MNPLSPLPFLSFSFLRFLDVAGISEVATFILQIRPPQQESFTQILSIGIGGSALGPQFVAEALAPDNPPLKVHGNICVTIEYVGRWTRSLKFANRLLF